jgi:hypothetical protein
MGRHAIQPIESGTWHRSCSIERRHERIASLFGSLTPHHDTELVRVPAMGGRTGTSMSSFRRQSLPDVSREGTPGPKALI